MNPSPFRKMLKWSGVAGCAALVLMCLWIWTLSDWEPLESLPFIKALILVGAPTSYLWLSDWSAARRARSETFAVPGPERWCCPKCNYDCTDIDPSAPCPECNAATRPERK